jgi:hypothetical protein
MLHQVMQNIADMHTVQIPPHALQVIFSTYAHTHTHTHTRDNLIVSCIINLMYHCMPHQVKDIIARMKADAMVEKIQAQVTSLL